MPSKNFLIYASVVIVFFALIIVLPLYIKSGGFVSGSDDSAYNKCITESMKNVTNDIAAREIKKSCRERFPIKTPPTYVLTDIQMRNVRGKASIRKFTNSTYFTGTIYNGNSNITITKVKISIVADNENPETWKDYWYDIYVEPLSGESFDFNILSIYDEGFIWGISEVIGYNSR